MRRRSRITRRHMCSQQPARRWHALAGALTVRGSHTAYLPEPIRHARPDTSRRARRRRSTAHPPSRPVDHGTTRHRPSRTAATADLPHAPSQSRRPPPPQHTALRHGPSITRVVPHICRQARMPTHRAVRVGTAQRIRAVGGRHRLTGSPAHSSRPVPTRRQPPSTVHRTDRPLPGHHAHPRTPGTAIRPCPGVSV